jgi:hypothetical protein
MAYLNVIFTVRDFIELKLFLRQLTPFKKLRFFLHVVKSISKYL